jgi:hypothetical protein
LSESGTCWSNFVYCRYHIWCDAPFAFAQGSTNDIGSLIAKVVDFVFLGEDGEVKCTVHKLGLAAIDVRDSWLVGMEPDEKVFERRFRDIWEHDLVAGVVECVAELLEVSRVLCQKVVRDFEWVLVGANEHFDTLALYGSF